MGQQFFKNEVQNILNTLPETGKDKYIQNKMFDLCLKYIDNNGYQKIDIRKWVLEINREYAKQQETKYEAIIKDLLDEQTDKIRGTIKYNSDKSLNKVFMGLDKVRKSVEHEGDILDKRFDYLEQINDCVYRDMKRSVKYEVDMFYREKTFLQRLKYLFSNKI